MTPSDKKRLMDAKNSKTNKVSVPELKPETKLERKSVSTPSSSPSVKATNNHEEHIKRILMNNHFKIIKKMKRVNFQMYKMKIHKPYL